MYTLDYIKTLRLDFEEWDLDPGSMVWPTQHYNLDESDEDALKNLVAIEDEDEFIDAIREILQDYLTFGTVKTFRIFDPTGKLVGEYDDEFYK